MDKELLRILSHIMVISMIGKELACLWWDRPNKFFSMETPNKIWINNPKAVYNYIASCADGYD